MPALDGAVRSAVAVLAGLAITCAAALVVWAITPSAGGGPEPLVRAGVATFLLAHFGSLTIGTAQLTLSPLLLTVLFAGTLAVSASRGRALGADVRREASWIAGGAVGYGVLVALVAAILAPPGSVGPSVGIGAGLLAVVSLTGGMLWRGAALRNALVEVVPEWVITSIRAGVAAAASMLAGAAMVFTTALLFSFSRAVALTDGLTNGFGEGVGLTLAGLGYLPNAVLTTVGYVCGVGFEVGSGRFSPFGNLPADLPPFPLLAAVPHGTGVSWLGVLSLLIPVGAGLVAGLSVVRRHDDGRDRLWAVGGAGTVAAAIVGVLIGLAGGGVSGGSWARIGAPALPAAGVVLAAVLIVGVTWVLSAGGWRPAPARSVSQQVPEPEPDYTPETVDDPDGDETDGDETDGDETDGDETDEPDTDEPDTDEPDTDEPDTDEPDTDEPDTDEPDTDEPDTDPAAGGDRPRS